MYAIDTYRTKGYTKNLYDTQPVKLPRAEFYMIYAGKGRVRKDTLKFSDLTGGPCDIEATVHILQKAPDHPIITQYVRFCEICNEERTRGNSAKRIWERCIEEGIAKSILAICDLLSPEHIAERFQLSVDEVMRILRANGKVL